MSVRPTYIFKRSLREVRSLARLAMPLISGLVLSTGLMLVDTLMLGPLGAVPLAVVSLTSSVMIIFWAALYGFAGPVGLFVGRAFGAADANRIGHVVRHGFVLAALGGCAAALVMCALLLALPWLGQPAEVLANVAPYWLCMAASLVPFTLAMVAKNALDATNQAWTAVALSVLPVGLNAALNWVLIYGNLGAPALGLLGAGIASLAAQTFAALLLAAYVRLAPGLAGWWLKARWCKTEMKRQWREALPMTLQYFMEGSAVAVAGVLIGLFGTTALAGNQITLSVGTTLYMLPLGVAGAVTIRIAQVVGARGYRRAAPIGYAGLGVVTLWMGLMAFIFIYSGADIARLFVKDEAVIAAAASIFFVFGLMQLVDGVQSVSLGALRGLLDNTWPTRVSIMAYWGIALPLAGVMGFGLNWGAPGVWGGFAAGLAFAAVALLRRFNKLSASRLPCL